MEILVPISICAILPIAVVLITALTKINADNKRSQVITHAIDVDANKESDLAGLAQLMESFKKPQKTPREILNLRLLRGCIFALIGAVLIIFGIINFAMGARYSDEEVGVSLMFGGISLAIGLSYLIVYFVTRKQVDSEETK